VTVDVSKELPLLPLRSVVVFPGATIPVEIGRLASLKLVDDLAGRGVGLLVGMQRDPDVEEPAREDLYDVCVEGALVRLVRATEQRWTLVVRGLRRRRIARVVRDSPYLVATSHPVHEAVGDEFPLGHLSADLESAVDKLVAAGDVPAAAVEAVRASGDIDLSDLTAGLLGLPTEQQTALLLELDIGRRRYRLLRFLEERLARLGGGAA
jgi:ATP-dependent Lon protease